MQLRLTSHLQLRRCHLGRLKADQLQSAAASDGNDA